MKIRAVSIVVLITFISLLLYSCTEDASVNPTSKTDIENPGKLHNALVTAFIDANGGKCDIQDRDCIALFVRVSQELFAREGIEFVPTEETIRTFMSKWMQWTKTETCDFTTFYRTSPTAIIDGFRESEAIASGDVAALKNIFIEMKRASEQGSRYSSDLPTMPANSTESLDIAIDVSQHSSQLWFDVYGDEKINVEPDDIRLAEWWKTVIKYITVAGSDTVIAYLGTYAFANPWAGVFLGALASLAVMDAFDERDW